MHKQIPMGMIYDDGVSGSDARGSRATLRQQMRVGGKPEVSDIFYGTPRQRTYALLSPEQQAHQDELTEQAYTQMFPGA